MDFLTLSAARIRKESMTCSAVSTSVDSLVIKSRKQSNCTYPLAFGSTIDKIRWKSISPCKNEGLFINTKDSNYYWQRLGDGQLYSIITCLSCPTE